MNHYWKLRLIRIHPIKLHFKLDTDRDGVIDHKDCRPFNRYKQDEDENKYRRKRYAEREDVRQYHKDFAQRPEVKEKRESYNKEYRNRPEVKALKHEQYLLRAQQRKKELFGDLEEWEDQEQNEYDEEY